MKVRSAHSTKFVILLVIVVSAFFFADLIPYNVRSFSYALSLAIKEILVFSLPLIVFGIVCQSVSTLHGTGAIRTVLLLLAMIVLSNSASVSVAHIVGQFTSSTLSERIISSGALERSDLMEPYFSFKLPILISSMKAVFLGFLAGAILPKVFGKKSGRISRVLSSCSILFLERIFAPVLPIFILGLVFRMHSDNLPGVLISNSEVLLYLFCSATLYIVMLYLVASGFSVQKALGRLRDMLPPTLFAFTTMSSLIALPIILKTAKKNSQDGEIMDIAVPTALNVHLVGDCFFIVAIAMVISTAFGSVEITPSDYLLFLLYFIASKFAVVAVPGGGIIVMLPIIEQYLHFSPTMLSLITTLYVVFDPVITSVNVLGNGAFSLLFAKVHNTLLKR